MHAGTEERTPWHGLEVRHLSALLAVARERSFRGAAEELGYVQSAVSQQLAGLERIVGARLVERARGNAPVSLTAEGEVLVGHFEAVLARIVAARAEVRAVPDGQQMRIRIGLSDRAATRLLARAARRLDADGDERIEVELVESAECADHGKAVESGRLDAAVCELPLPPGAFECIELFADPYVLLVPRAWPLAERDAMVSVEDLLGLPLIGHRIARSVLERVDEPSLRAGPPKLVLDSDSDASVQALVGEEIGAAIMPRSVIDEADDRIVALALGQLVPPRVLALYFLRARGAEPALAALRRAVLEAVSPGACTAPLRLAS